MPFYKRSALFFQVIFILGPLILQVLSIELSDKTNLVGKQVKKNSNLRGAANGEVKEYLSGESITRTRREGKNSRCGSGESEIRILSKGDVILESADGKTIVSSSRIRSGTCVPQDKCFLLTMESVMVSDATVTVDGESTTYIFEKKSSVVVISIGSCECEAGTKKVEIGIRSDASGIDNHFIVKERNNKNNWQGNSFSMNGFPNNADIRVSKCLPDDECYKFFLFDTVDKDGIIGDDVFDVIWDGEYVIEGGTSQHGRKPSSPKFGKC